MAKEIFVQGLSIKCPVLSGDVSILDVIAPAPHPDDLDLTLKLRECKTREESLFVLREHGFYIGGENN